MADRRDDHEDTRREQAASIAGLQADVRRDHEYIESVSAKSQEVARTVQELEVKAARVCGRVERIEGDVKRGSGRMEKIEGKQATMDRRLAWYAGALTAGAFLAPFLGDIVKQLILGH